jgi:hypothetical protein
LSLSQENLDRQPVRFVKTYVRCASGLKVNTKELCTVYKGGPKNTGNLNVARELEAVARCAARCRDSTQYSSSLPHGVSLG